jgi:hypothetical protein
MKEYWGIFENGRARERVLDNSQSISYISLNIFKNELIYKKQ